MVTAGADCGELVFGVRSEEWENFMYIIEYKKYVHVLKEYSETALSDICM